MRAVVQRVRDCSIRVENTVAAAMPHGLLVYVGVEIDDTEKDADYLADKILNLRIFPDDEDKMNLSVLELPGYGITAVSQFTLCGDTRRGRRPSYSRAAGPKEAVLLYTYFIDRLKNSGPPVFEGVFQAHMDVQYTNYGPVTILLDSKKQF